MPEIADALLDVADLRIETDSGRDIVDDVSFSVYGGETVALVGESGCGKTTTALALLGHARPGTTIAHGTVRLRGRNILELSDPQMRQTRGSAIAYVPQDPTSSLSPRQRVGNQIREALRIHGVADEEATGRVPELFARVQLPTDRRFLRRYPFELSGGQQQRVAIAMALSCAPSVIVLDEPTTGLDVTTQARVLALIGELARDTGAGFVYVTHDLAVVDVLADRVLVMYAGRVVESGARAKVFARPAHPYTVMLLDSVPRLAVRNNLVGIRGTTPPPGMRPSGCFFHPRCPLSFERCEAEFPPPSVAADGHVVRCWRAAQLTAANLSLKTDALIAEPPSRAVLTVSDVVASYGRGARSNVALDGVSFALASGECLALVGESGSGKSTLGRCIVGLHAPDAGTISLNGVPLAGTAAGRSRVERRAIQIVFQNPERSLNPSHTVEAIIRRPLELFEPGSRADRAARVDELLDRVRLPSALRHRYPRELSGGEKQRVAVARALAAGPQILVSDEITSALDVSIQAAIVSLLEELRGDGLAILFITHNVALVNSIADRVLVLERGAIREAGLTAMVVGSPSHEYTRELIAAAPDLLTGVEEARLAAPVSADDG